MYKQHVVRIIAVFLGFFILTGCGGFYKEKGQQASFTVNKSEVWFGVVLSKVLEPKCNTCHRPGGAASFAPFQTYEQVELKVAQIKARALGANKDMPPSGSPSLSPSESQLLSVWIDAGAPETAANPGTSTNPTPDPNPKPDQIEAKYSQIQEKIIKLDCLKCHGTNATEPRLVSYADVRATVDPKDPEKSLFYVAITRAKFRMPLKAPALSENKIAAIKKWITDGALDDSASPPPPVPPATLEAKFSIIKSKILEPKCMGCHTAGTGGGSKVVVDTVKALVTGKLVVPGKSDQSSLVSVLIDPDASNRMPMSADPLSEAEIGAIKKWIDEGAIDDTAPNNPPDKPPGPPDQPPTPPPGPTQPPVVVEPKFSSIKTKIFEAKCFKCHKPNPTEDSLPRLDSVATMISDKTIIPGKAEEGGLIPSLTETGPDRMPKGADALSENELSAIRKWINDGAIDDTAPPTPPPAPVHWTFDTIKSKIFDLKCVGCHTPGDPKDVGISLATRADLIEKELVIPGKAEASDLLKSLLKTGRGRMPKGADALPANEIEAVRSWINEGAL